MTGRRLPLRRLHDGTDGDAIVEFALVIPILLGIIAVCFQFAMIFLTFVSVMYGSRDIGRWLAVNPHTIDSVAIAAVKSRLPEDLDPANLTVTISPSCASLNLQGKCASRPLGTQLTISMTYDASAVWFFPRPAGFSTFLPTYTTYFEVAVN